MQEEVQVFTNHSGSGGCSNEKLHSSQLPLNDTEKIKLQFTFVHSIACISLLIATVHCSERTWKELSAFRLQFQ